MSNQKNQIPPGIQAAVDRLWENYDRLNHPPQGQQQTPQTDQETIQPENWGHLRLVVDNTTRD